MKLLKMVRIGSQTLVGVGDMSKYPLNRGNCFSVEADDGNRYNIVNFYVENLQNSPRKPKGFSVGMNWA